jgi:hypothetical protein
VSGSGREPLRSLRRKKRLLYARQSARALCTQAPTNSISDVVLSCRNRSRTMPM